MRVLAVAVVLASLTGCGRPVADKEAASAADAGPDMIYDCTPLVVCRGEVIHDGTSFTRGLCGQLGEAEEFACEGDPCDEAVTCEPDCVARDRCDQF